MARSSHRPERVGTAPPVDGDACEKSPVSSRAASATSAPAEPFWRTVPLAEMSAAQWESLCDGCGKCCLNKLEDEDTGHIVFTHVACRLLDDETCRCSDYANRRRHVPECISLTPDMIGDLRWLPRSCAYRAIAEGRDLEWWHHLVSGDPDTVHEAGISMSGTTVSESAVPVEEWEAYAVDLDMLDPDAGLR